MSEKSALEAAPQAARSNEAAEQNSAHNLPIIAFVDEGWTPEIRPSSHKRSWMDETSDSYAYRCLPLNIANAHGWESLLKGGFEAEWNGGSSADDITFDHDDPNSGTKPVSIFGFGIITIHFDAIIRTPPGWNIWAGGSPNSVKDGIAPLTGIIETDWSPYTFTMNWKFTRPGRVRFDKDEPYLFFFPVQRGSVEAFDPTMVSLNTNPDLKKQFRDWSVSRDSFLKAVKELEKERQLAPSETWQKRYYRGLDMTDTQVIADHQSRLRLRPFRHADASSLPRKVESPKPRSLTVVADRTANANSQVTGLTGNDAPTANAGRDLSAHEVMVRIAEPMMMGAEHAELVQIIRDMGGSEQFANRFLQEAARHPFMYHGRNIGLKLRKRDWMMRTEQQHRVRSGRLARIGRIGPISVDAFYREYHGMSIPVVLSGLVSDWPAVMTWTPDLLLEHLGDKEVEVQINRASDPLFEVHKHAHKSEMRFSDFLREALDPEKANEFYMTAFNHKANLEAMKALFEQMAPLPDILSPAAPPQMWIGGASTLTPLHHDLNDVLLVQIVGRKRLTLIPPAEASHLRNNNLVFSGIADIHAPQHADILNQITHFDLVVGPGDAIFIPIGWWHQVTALDFSVSASYTAFRDPCDYDKTYPHQ